MNDLRSGFKERHNKCLYEAIDMVPPTAKKACPERAQEESSRGAPLVVVPQLDVARPSSTPTAKKKACGKETGTARGRPLVILLRSRESRMRRTVLLL